MVVDQLEAGLVEDGASVGLGHGETDGIGETLAEGASGDLDTRGVVGLGVAGCDAVDLLWTVSRASTSSSRRATDAEVLQVVDGDLVAEQVDQRILEHAAVTVAGSPVSACNCFSGG